ncbi:tRNA 2-thiouridine(34) synthase MnmA [Clostridium rectalis]|uniref:tRNA 2-thiouridine(34) synthase MnmA n=1 Tax=Clostridium rectalis TaxID=2040295 RepID=UPI000F633133|nr:tRNA 2-thiouridine(34) synthase MnmA [Clostridium rectalis]
MSKKVVLGMSGGVDSSVAAYLLQKQGYEVIGVTMKVWEDSKNYEQNQGGCCSLFSVEDARRVAYKLKIPFYVMDFKDEFKDKIIGKFIKEYVKGRTPNPCIDCNKYIKFHSFLNRALNLGADYMATGHYARIEKEDGRYIIKKGIDNKKDQSYVLYNFTQHQLKHTLLPCGGYTKDNIRKIAKTIGLEVYDKKDSEEICFIPDNNHGKFIEKEIKKDIKAGYFINKQGKVLGKHKGIVYYTIGQRKGLGISTGKPLYVLKINPKTNQIVLGENEELFKNQLIAKDLNFIPFEKLSKSMEVDIKIRYTSKISRGIIIPIKNNAVIVKLFEDERAITKGQSVVFYSNDMLIGGGVIHKVIDSVKNE